MSKSLSIPGTDKTQKDLETLHRQFPYIDLEVISAVYHDQSNDDFKEAQRMLLHMQPEEAFEDKKGYDEGVVDPENDNVKVVLSKEPQNHNHQLRQQSENGLTKEVQEVDPTKKPELIVPHEMPPSINLSDSLFREILLYMRVQLKSDQLFFSTVKVLHIILKNIVNDPTNPKYQRLKLSNEKVKKAIAQCEQSRFILEMLGFELVKWKDESLPDGLEEDYYILNQERIDMREFNLLISIIDELFRLNNLTPLTKNMEDWSTRIKEE